MNLDLRKLRTMHPLLAKKTVAEYAHRAAVGLERHGHRPGVRLLVVLDSHREDGNLHWIRSAPGDAEQLDRNRIIEDAAEAVALALVSVANGWTVRRRLQKGEAADWLLLAPDGVRVALEVSGIDVGPVAGRLRIKTEQVRRATIADVRAACVVELAAPQAVLGSVWKS